MAALAAIKELVTICGESSITRNPIAAYELMTGDSYAYSPLAYGYSNYSRMGYAIRSHSPLVFGAPPKRLGKSLCTTLGGAGLAVSARCKGLVLDTALNYAQFVASGPVQTGLFTASGGQPGYRSAWLDAENNRITRSFFTDTLGTLDRAYVRPRHERAIEFQTCATVVMDSYLRSRSSSRETLNALDDLDRRLRRVSSHKPEGTL